MSGPILGIGTRILFLREVKAATPATPGAVGQLASVSSAFSSPLLFGLSSPIAAAATGHAHGNSNKTRTEWTEGKITGILSPTVFSVLCIADGTTHAVEGSQIKVFSVTTDLAQVLDLCHLPDIHVPAVSYLLQQRWKLGHYCTWCGGNALLYVNPYRWVDDAVIFHDLIPRSVGNVTAALHQQPQEQPKHHPIASAASSTPPPHVYSVAAKIFSQMSDHCRSTVNSAAAAAAAPCSSFAVVVTGESGAGKTEATKMLLSKFMALVKLHGSQMLAVRDENNVSDKNIAELLQTSLESSEQQRNTTAHAQVTSASSPTSSSLAGLGRQASFRRADFQHPASTATSSTNATTNTSLQGSHDGALRALHSVHPILESFGNACTTLNDNSSRFAKLVTVDIVAPSSSSSSNLNGNASATNAAPGPGVTVCVSIKCMLLETTRVVSRSPLEGNFHIFYSLIEGVTPQEREELDLYDSELFEFLRTRTSVGGSLMNDADADGDSSSTDEDNYGSPASSAAATATPTVRFATGGTPTTSTLTAKEQQQQKQRTRLGASKQAAIVVAPFQPPYKLSKVREAMKQIGINDSEQLVVFKLLAAILHLGNVQFVDASGSSDPHAPAKIKSMKPVEKAASLLGVGSSGTLAKALTAVVLNIGSKEVTRELNTASATATRDSMARVLYESIFFFLVERMNRFFRGVAGKPPSSSQAASTSGENTTTAATAAAAAAPKHNSASSKIKMQLHVLDIFGFESVLPGAGAPPSARAGGVGTTAVAAAATTAGTGFPLTSIADASSPTASGSASIQPTPTPTPTTTASNKNQNSKDTTTTTAATTTKNSIEQLLINYTNEVLQHAYNERTFSELEREMEIEGVSAPETTMSDEVKELASHVPLMSPIGVGSAAAAARKQQQQQQTSASSSSPLSPPQEGEPGKSGASSSGKSSSGLPDAGRTYRSKEEVARLLECMTAKPNGIFNLIADECALGQKSSPENLLAKIHHLMRTRYPDCIKKDSRDLQSKTTFLLEHFCYEVKYDVSHFVAKSRTMPAQSVFQLLKQSNAPLVIGLETIYQQQHHHHHHQQQQQQQGGGSSSKQHSVIGTYTDQLQAIVKRLLSSSNSNSNSGTAATTATSTTTLWIRCVRPNAFKSATSFDASLVQHQLRSGGVFHTLQMLSTGYCVRMSHAQFARKTLPLFLLDLVSRHLSHSHSTTRAKGEKVLQYSRECNHKALCELAKDTFSMFSAPAQHLLIGVTTVFMMPPTQQVLEVRLHKQQGIISCWLQRLGRAFRTRHKLAHRHSRMQQQRALFECYARVERERGERERLEVLRQRLFVEDARSRSDVCAVSSRALTHAVPLLLRSVHTVVDGVGKEFQRASDEIALYDRIRVEKEQFFREQEKYIQNFKYRGVLADQWTADERRKQHLEQRVKSLQDTRTKRQEAAKMKRADNDRQENLVRLITNAKKVQSREEDEMLLDVRDVEDTRTRSFMKRKEHFEQQRLDHRMRSRCRKQEELESARAEKDERAQWERQHGAADSTRRREMLLLNEAWEARQQQWAKVRK